MKKQILKEIENMKANNISLNDMVNILSEKFKINIKNAKQWISTAALANSLGLNLLEI